MTNTVVKVDPQDKRGQWEGWGCSFAWWAHAVGAKKYESLYADLFFTPKMVPFLDQQLPGLNFNIIRYNVGGGGRRESIGATVEKVPDILPWHRDIDGYWINWTDKDPKSASWDWSRDAGQRSMMKAAVQRGVNHVEFFSNAPMWWMMDSKSSAGGRLQPWNKRDFALYLATVTQHAQQNWGVQVDYLEPFNEPSAGWWNYPKNQEGANISRQDQADVLGFLREELDQRGLRKVAITASDENSMQAARSTHEFFKTRDVTVNGKTKKTVDIIEKVNVHSYNGLEPMRDNQARERLRQSVGSKKLWADEYGDNDASGIRLAQTITEDINFLRPTAWVYWQPLEPGSPWGPVNGVFGEVENPNAGAPKEVFTKYFVLAQFTRAIPQGATILGSNDPNTVVAYHAKKRQLSFVTTSYQAPQTIEYDLSNFRKLPGEATLVTTHTNGSKRFETSRVTIEGKKVVLNAAPNTVYSLTLEQVGL
jgi:galactan endo-1,6-beta-galactosidase